MPHVELNSTEVVEDELGSMARTDLEEPADSRCGARRALSASGLHPPRGRACEARKMTGAGESNSESKARVSTMTTWSEHSEECQSSAV